MSRTLTGESLIFLLLLLSSVAGEKVTERYSLDDVNVFELNLTNFHEESPYLHQVSIQGNKTVRFNVTNVLSSAAFMIFQIHVYEHNVTLAYDEESLNKASNRSVFGSNVGLFNRLTGLTTTQFVVKNENPDAVEALIIAIPYNAKAPVPGGCNMEFATEIAPYARVQTLPEMVIVDVQPPSMPLQSIASSGCDVKTNPVSVEIYQMFLDEQDFSSEGYFSAISSMLTVKDIKTNGIEVQGAFIMSSLRRIFSAYTGVGSVYVAVAKYEENYAAYVPAFSYACYPTIDPASCTILSGFTQHFICACCFLIGASAIVLNYKLILFDKVIVLCIVGPIIGYMLYVNLGIIALLIYLAVMIVITFLRLIFFLGDVLYGAMTLGFLCACFTYYNSPDAFIAVHDNTIFWLLFVSIACAVGVGTLCMCHLSHVVTYCICAGLMTMLPIDYYVGSNLKYIFINVIRRATVEDFHLASIQHPTQARDIILIVGWVGLAICHFVKYFRVTSGAPGPEEQPLLSRKTNMFCLFRYKNNVNCNV